MAQMGDFKHDEYLIPPDFRPRVMSRESIQASYSSHRVVARPRGENCAEWMRRALRMSRFWIEETMSIPLKEGDAGYAAQTDFLQYGPMLVVWDTTKSGSGGRKANDDEQTSD